MSGFVPKSGRPTKGGSLSESPRSRKLLRYFFRHEPSVGSSRNDAASLNHAYPASLQKIIVELVSSDRAAALNFESRSDGQTLPRPLGSGAIAAAIFPSDDAAEVSAARMLRWKRILDVTCIVLSSPFWLPVMTLVMGL